MEKNIFVPNAVVDFRCTMCGKCCSGWHINLRKEEYSFIEENIDKISGRKLSISDVCNVTEGKKADDKHYASFKFDERGRCFFVDDNNSCTWFANFGKDKGAFVCQTFPIYNFLTPKGQFYNISFYCTSAARFLFNYNFEFGFFSQEHSFVPYDQNMHDFSKHPYVKLGFDVYLEWDSFYLIEELIVDVYNISDTTFFNKMYLIAHFVNLLYLNGNRKVTKDVVLAFKNLFLDKQKDVVDELNAFPSDVGYQLENIKYLLNYRKSLYPNNKVFAAFASEADIFLKDTSRTKKAFQEKYNHYRNYFDEHEAVFLNYFFHKISNNILLPEQGVSAGIKIAVGLYLLLRFFIVLRLTENKDFKDVFVSVVYDIEKYFFHDRKIFSFWSRNNPKEPCILSMDIIRMVRI